ncbi:Fic/DOC family protein [Alkalicoccus chagannorensis]|uniref:Fic/DOC family protein n=1 Tax=Alkalicoccus chagannorensis TaxID=427072 RepID=UPI000425C501|nr:Fic family protein [Alkalicoccus chagannorensis]
MDKYQAGVDDLLRHNRIGAESEEELAELEALAFAARASSLSDWPSFLAPFDEASLLRLHYHLFQDVYDFAGEYRTVQLAKGTTRFCQAEHLKENAEALFRELQEEPEWPTLEKAAERLAYWKTELNMLHPFREGNGRVIRFFLYGWALSIGVLWKLEEMNREQYMEAMVRSVMEEAPLRGLFLETIQWDKAGKSE